MIPKTVAFTGLDVNPQETIQWRLHPGPFPREWSRCSFESNYMNISYKLVKWLLDNIHGRFGLIFKSNYAVVYFEKDVDLVLFRMLDGENVWAEDA